MASSYSTDLKLELMVTGENAGTWGDKTNTNLNLVQQAIAGVESITLTDGGTKALAMSDAALSEARNMVLKIATITLSSASNLTIPDGIEKFYILDATGVTNPTNLTFKTASGTGFTLDAAKIYAAYADGTNIVEVSLDSLGGTIGSAQIADNAVVTAKISNANVTTAKIADNAITSAKISANQITSDKISANQITQAKIADDAVGPDQLSNTAVTAGDYTVASITVDAQGRITAASSGSSGAGGFALNVVTNGPASGTYTAPANTNAIMALMQGAGGGGSRSSPGEAGQGRPGGAGGFAYYFTPVTAPYSSPFSVGGGGAAGNQPPPYGSAPGGAAGGATSIQGVGTANGGNGGNAHPAYTPGNPGTSGNASPTGTISGLSRSYLMADNKGNGGGTAGSGQPGRLSIFENIGS